MNRSHKKRRYLVRYGILPLHNRINTLLVTAIVGILASSSVQSAPSFPHFPLTSGAGNAVPPNVMLILDDSGSMEWSFMPTTRLMNNYNRWVIPQKLNQADGGKGELSFLCYGFEGVNRLSRQTNQGMWYWDDEDINRNKPACDNPGRYLEGSWSDLKRFDNGLVRSYDSNAIYYNPSKTYLPWRTKTPLPEDKTKEPERLPNADVSKVSDHSSSIDLSDGELDLINSPHSVFFVPNRGGYFEPGSSDAYYKYRIGKNGSGGAEVQRCTANDTSQCTENSSNWIADTPTMKDDRGQLLPDISHTQRSQKDELQNFANWFHYHSTRLKMAKAGASEAFGTLEANIRIGYDVINSKAIVHKITGLFEGNNRATFYEKLQNQTATGYTPLRSALERTGEYYSTDEPYKNNAGTPLNCRRNYAILVTDGAWTQDTSKFASLSRVAHHYWANDLRPSLHDNVPLKGNDYADWQHMTTFGISVGMDRPNGRRDTPEAEYSSYVWKNKIPKSHPDFERRTRTWLPYIRATVDSSDINKIEDLAWAAGESYGKYFMADNTEGFSKALEEILSSAVGSEKSSSGVAVSSSTLDTSTRAFHASFSSGSWSGELASTLLTGKGGDWALSQTFEGGVNANFSTRTVLRGKGSGNSGAVAFDSGFASGSAASVLARTSGTDAVSAEDNIKWLRGEEINKLRTRKHPIGDIVHSTPAYSSDTKSVYVGANDGMLHGINSEDGKVLFSYIPGGVDLATLAKLSSPKYEHRFFVDGSIDVISKAHHGSKTILLAAMGRGGRGVFSLDVTDPKTMGSTQVVWDDTVPASNTTYLPDMGYVLGGVHLRRANGPNRTTVALIPNGIDSPSGCAALIVREIHADGSAANAKTLSTNECGNNGLMALALADLDHNGTVDLVYGGDLKGNVWRWNFKDGVPSTQAVKLFSGDPSRPITGGLVVSATIGGTGSKIFVGFGTGRYISLDDVPKLGALGSPQRLYGIIDHGDDNPPLTLNDANLIERKLHINGLKRAFDAYEDLPTDKEGWYVNLAPPERVIYPPNIAGSAMYITTAIPDVSTTTLAGDDCDNASGGGYIYAINLFTGTSPRITDPYFRAEETITVNGVEVPIGGISSGSIPTGVELLVGKDGEIEVLYDAGDGKLRNEHGNVLPVIDPLKKGRLSWREILRF